MVDRFWEKVEVRGDSECWNWMGATYVTGYGSISLPGWRTGSIKAHRFSAMLHFGMFDRRLWVLHHCDNRLCVNPAHLYLGDVRDNARDAAQRGRLAAMRQTHCRHGHELTPSNIFPDVNGHRRCRKCSSRRGMEYRARKRAAIHEGEL